MKEPRPQYPPSLPVRPSHITGHTDTHVWLISVAVLAQQQQRRRQFPSGGNDEEGKFLTPLWFCLGLSAGKKKNWRAVYVACPVLKHPTQKIRMDLGLTGSLALKCLRIGNAAPRMSVAFHDHNR